jgi:hypothetical protein
VCRGAALAAVAAISLLAACSDLLPKNRTEVESRWSSYDEAHATIERIVPYKTTLADLRQMGIDPFVNANVQVLTYSDIVLRFPLSGTLPMEKLDPGLRECLEAGKRCQGFTISVREINRNRVGNFWLDAFHFERVTDTTGWTFSAIILAVNEQVVYEIHGGQPVVRETEVTKLPLGPLQSWGDRVPAAIP